MQLSEIEQELREHVANLFYCRNPIAPPRDTQTCRKNGYHEAEQYIVSFLESHQIPYKLQAVSTGKQIYHNIIAGALENPALLLTAHLDTAYLSPGADDNTSAVAVLLTLLHHLPKHQPVQFIFFALEEGTRGTAELTALHWKLVLKAFVKVLTTENTLDEEEEKKLLKNTYDTFYQDMCNFFDSILNQWKPKEINPSLLESSKLHPPYPLTYSDISAELLAAYKHMKKAAGLFKQLDKDMHEFTREQLTNSQTQASSSPVAETPQNLASSSFSTGGSTSPSPDPQLNSSEHQLTFKALLESLPVLSELAQTVFQYSLVGSQHYLKEQAGTLQAAKPVVINLESVGYYSSEPDSQKTVNGVFPSIGDFLALLYNSRSHQLAQNLLKQSNEEALRILPLRFEHHASLDLFFRADHLPFWFLTEVPCVTLTDTINYRNPNYHLTTDKPDTLDYHKLTRVFVLLKQFIDNQT